MPSLFSQMSFIPLSSINFVRAERQRTGIVTDGLKESIAKRGIMSPLLVREKSLILVAGERRLTAAQELGLPEVPVRFVAESATPIEIQLIELEENIKRQDLPWQDVTRSIGKIHNMFRDKDPDWTRGETAAEIGLTPGTLSIHLTVFAALEEERIAEAGTVREAYNILLRRQEREQGNAMANLLELSRELAGDEPATAPKPDTLLILDTIEGEREARREARREAPLSVPIIDARAPADYRPAQKATPETLIDGEETAGGEPPIPEDFSGILMGENFLEWAPAYKGKLFNFLHCDFPYGIEFASGRQAGAERQEHDYEDSPDLYFSLLEALLKNLDNFCTASAHLMFWFSAKNEAKTRRFFDDLAPSFKLVPYPLVWFKSDNAGIAGDARRHPRHVYETALMAYRADRNVVKIVADCYAAPTDKSEHISAKPIPVLRHFFSMLVDNHTTLLDPTCGSGTALRAAESLGATRVLGLEIDPEVGARAADKLSRARIMRAAGL